MWPLHPPYSRLPEHASLCLLMLQRGPQGPVQGLRTGGEDHVVDGVTRRLPKEDLEEEMETF